MPSEILRTSYPSIFIQKNTQHIQCFTKFKIYFRLPQCLAESTCAAKVWPLLFCPVWMLREDGKLLFLGHWPKHIHHQQHLRMFNKATVRKHALYISTLLVHVNYRTTQLLVFVFRLTSRQPYFKHVSISQLPKERYKFAHPIMFCMCFHVQISIFSFYNFHSAYTNLIPG